MPRSTLRREMTFLVMIIAVLLSRYAMLNGCFERCRVSAKTSDYLLRRFRGRFLRIAGMIVIFDTAADARMPEVFR